MSRYGTSFHEPAETEADRLHLRDELRKRDDWTVVEEYAATVAQRRLIRELDALQRRIAEWKRDRSETVAEAQEEFRDCVIDLLHANGAEGRER